MTDGTKKDTRRKRKYDPATKIKRNKRSRDARSKRVTAGLCASCGNRPPAPGLTRCQVCRDYHKQYRIQRIKAKLCGMCLVQPAIEGRRCQACFDRDKTRRETLKAQGLCTACGVNPVTDGKPSCCDCRRIQTIRASQRRLEVLTHYGLVCACCGESTYEFLQIDHMHNDGARHRREIGRSLYSWLQKQNYPKGFQTLCANCNIAKAQHGVCPHERVRRNNEPVV